MQTDMWINKIQDGYFVESKHQAKLASFKTEAEAHAFMLGVEHAFPTNQTLDLTDKDACVTCGVGLGGQPNGTQYCGNCYEED